MQLSLNFLNQPQPAMSVDRLEPAQRAEVVQILAGIIAKAACRSEPPSVKEIATTNPAEEIKHD